MSQIGVNEIEHLLPKNPYDRRAILGDPTEMAKLKARKAREAREQQAQQQSPAARKAWEKDWNDWAAECFNTYLIAVMAKGGWLHELLGEVIGRKAADVRKHMLDEVAKLRRELVEATAKLQERLARLPRVEEFQPETVYYAGDCVTCNGATWQARKDTGQRPGHHDWILVAAAGVDGRSPKFRGTFDAYEKYKQFDVTEFDGSSFIAVRDDPGIPGDPGWMIVSRRGGRGPAGEVGPRGRTGKQGPRGKSTPVIIDWVVDKVHYAAHPIMSDGRPGPVLQLRELFQQFIDEGAMDAAVETAVQDAARKAKLLSPL
jgi:hypothetical protein